MRQSLRVARAYGQPPSWWDGLTRGDQALLLADLRIQDREHTEAVKAAQRASQR